MEEIVISPKTVEKLKSLTQEIQNIQATINIILETVVLEHNGDGQYELTKDWKLIKKQVE